MTQHTQTDWEKLIARALQKDESAVSEMIRLTKSYGLFSARIIAGSQDSAEEILQRTYIKIFSNLENLRDPEKFLSWMHAIIRREALNYFAETNRKHSVVFSDLNPTDDEGSQQIFDPADDSIDSRPDLQMDQKAKQEIIEKIMESLPQEQRLTIYMYYYDQLKISEIAAAMQCSENTVKSRLKYGKDRIRDLVSRMEKTEGIRLHGLAPVPFFLYLLDLVRQEQNTGFAAMISRSAAASASGTVNAQIAREAAKPALHAARRIPTAAKIWAGCAAAAVGVTGVAGTVLYHASKKPQQTMVSAVPSASPVPSEEPEIIWTVSPQENIFLDAESVTILSGRVDAPNEAYSGVNGYPSQWASSDYSGDVLKVKKNGSYILCNYEGEQLTEPFSNISTSFYISMIEQAPDYFGNAPANPDVLFYASDQKIRCTENDTVFPDDITVTPLNSDFTAGEETTIFQGTGIGSLGLIYYVQDNRIYCQNLLGESEEVQSTDDIGSLFLHTENRDFILAEKNSSHETVGYRFVPSGQLTTVIIPYQPCGIPVNGIIPVISSAEPVSGTSEDSYNHPVDYASADKGIFAEGRNIGLFDASAGEMVSDFLYDAVGATEEGFTPVRENGKWGLLRLEDNMLVIDCILDEISSVYDGKVYVNYNGTKGILNLTETLSEMPVITEQAFS